jgi:monoamine oxidase
MPNEFDVAVIGAGMAGIIAARDLSQKGHSVVLLEAHDRIGGRTYTDHAFNGELDLDLGGGHVHWTQPHVWRELQRHGMSLKPPVEVGRFYWLADGAVHSGRSEDLYET